MRVILPFLAALLLHGCGSSRKQMASAEAYEQHGMLTEAFDMYAGLYHRRPKEALAHIGMKRVAQQQLNQLAQQSIEAYRLENLKEGDRLRNLANTHKKAMEARGLALMIDPQLEEWRVSAMRKQSERIARDAKAAMGQDRFKEAESLCAEAIRLWPDNREAEHLLRLARAEPLYREGARAMELGLWREGHRKFDAVARIDPAHKDALARRDRCREKAAYSLAYMRVNDYIASDFLSGATGQEISGQFAARVKEAVLELDDPLIMLVDQEHAQRLIKHQQEQMKGPYDEQHIAAAGKLMGARYVLAGRIMRFDDVLAKQMEVQMQLIDAETGQVHLSEVVRVNKQEIGRGAPRAQLMERAAKRMAHRLREFNAGL